MSIVSLPAHFDGRRICLDEPFNMEMDTKLIVTILPNLLTQKIDNEYEDWLFLSGQRLKGAYGENEPEYSSDLLKEVNPDYEAR
ncbi:MAG: hypothetical protein QME07_07820 [bacterium]|nr:hypothetical protein [bacterium]